MTVYQGLENNPESKLYGMPMTLQSLLISLSRLAFNFFANVVEVGNLGSMMKAFVFDLPLEFTVNWLSASMSILLLMIVGILGVTLMVWFAKVGKKHNLEKMLFIWVLSFFCFNFFWDDSSDQFWFQILPPLWILVLIAGRFTIKSLAPDITDQIEKTSINQTLAPPSTSTKVGFALFCCSLLIVNTTQSIGPRVFTTPNPLQQHQAIFSKGDLQVIPGWSEIFWLGKSKDLLSIEQEQLMHLALDATQQEDVMFDLPKKIKHHITMGKKVYVARLYDRDYDPRPWDNLRRLGWPRERIIGLLDDFEAHPISTINGVVIRELKPKQTMSLNSAKIH